MSRRLALVAALIVTALFVAGPTAAPSTAEAADDTNRYVPLTPCRLADQRVGQNLVGFGDGIARVATDRCDIPAEASAIVAYLTIAGPSANGWLVTHPTGTSRPNSAQLNWNAGVVRGNTATITLGNGGSFDLYKSDGWGSGNVVIDVVGAFVPAATSTSGRLVGISPGQRLLDTRESGRPLTDEVVRIPLPAGVPADASALAVTVTAINVRIPGFYTAYAAGTEAPFVSMLNTDRGGQFRAASTIVPVNADGFDLVVSGSSNVAVDVTGWFTGESADDSSDGLFVPLPPTRLRDTRPEQAPIWGGGAIEVGLDPAAIGGAAAIAASTTMVGVDVRGFTTSYAARTDRGPISTGYGEAAELTAQFGIVPVSASGLEVYSENATDLTVDVSGWFTGSPVAATRSGPAPNAVPRQRVAVIGDSILDGIRRNRGFGALRGASFEVRGESCRRLGARPSCGGIFDRFPFTAAETLASQPYGAFDIAVINTGYNDVPTNIERSIPMIMNAAQQIGVRRVIWFTYARDEPTDKGIELGGQLYAPHNAALRAAAADDHRLVVVDWGAVSDASFHWTDSDGLHLAGPGGRALSDFISRSVAHVVGRPCPMPWAPFEAIESPCGDPGLRAPIDPVALYPVLIPNPCVDVGSKPETICRTDS
ncbi:MAG: SGNH/GDSL hydrolase family protein [Actinomycetota bacterium]